MAASHPTPSPSPSLLQNRDTRSQTYRKLLQQFSPELQELSMDYLNQLTMSCSGLPSLLKILFPSKGTDKDWEKEAKKKIRIDLVDPLVERRKTIYELDSYEASGPSVYDILQLGKIDDETQLPPSPQLSREIRYSVSMGTAGVARINLSSLTQKILGCVIDENVTTEYPWVWVKKEIIEDNLDLHSESSEFLPMKNEILEYPEERMLIGYAPSVTEEGQFYICLSTEAKGAVLQQIQMQRREHEIHVRSAVYKHPAKWKDLGSGKEVDENVVKNQRPQLEIKVVSTANLLNVPMNLVDRSADDQRDGYIDLLPYRQTFENVSRNTISRSTQVTPGTKDNEAQTAPSIPANSWFQYRYEYKPIDISAFTEEDTDNLTRFLRRNTDTMCDQVQMNATWDIYADDYKNLVYHERDTKAPIPVGYKEHQSFYDGKLTKQKVINDLSWHPLWTGIACATYTHHSKAEHFVGQRAYDEVLRDSKGDNLALIWSFNDCLSPKLILECPREITAISICPLNSNVIIGGCVNGQIAIWSIPGRIENVEAVTVHTSAQVRYRIAMRSLMRWMRETVGSSVVRPVAMSSLQHSQKGAITQIAWIPPYHKVEKNGRIQSLAAGTTLEDLPWQFVTSSMDGTIAFWDLKLVPKTENSTKKETTLKEKQKQGTLPYALLESTSPFEKFNRIWKPYYMLFIHYPNENRRPVLSTFTMHSSKLNKQLDEPFPIIKTDITMRRYYKLIKEKPDYNMKPEILIGTIEGYVGLVTWEGFKIDTNLTGNHEECKWKWMKRIHDGPVTHMARSEYHEKIVATVGGHIFAIWREDYEEPIIWKKSNLSYTGCTWGNFRPTILVLVRIDGTIEIWDFIVKGQEPIITQSVSGRIITGIYTHELPLDPQCVGICDFNGTLRIFTAPPTLLRFDVSDITWMQNYADQQVDRIRKPWQFIEDAKEHWHEMEMKRMQITILEKKGLRRDVLERQRAPVLKLRQETQKKERQIREILQQRDQIFQETVTYLFPEKEIDHHKYTLDQKDISLPYIKPIPYEDKISTREDIEESLLEKEAQQIIEEFREVQEEALEKLLYQRSDHVFDWPTVLMEAKQRRYNMNIMLLNKNSC
ncbi:PREDICTED: WD repeat-containing protein 63-like [Polistes canadensis]|uniref:WD repeat-containing protein 63-like n=1 Tax=Polistes canadensis TaxID=91411 RepID=UPI0007190106|nr:PREDICTED: WD repeat-containing protein 63-like [Polistes canadensis]